MRSEHQDAVRPASRALAPLRLILAAALLTVGAGDGEARAEEETPEFYDPVQRDVAGWTIDIDPQLLEPENAEVADQAFAALANHLQRVALIVSEDKLERLRRLPIWVELHNPELSSMQYHPDRGWLLANGHDPRLVKHVHIPRAAELYDRRMWAKHPYVVLHELAHAYHDQVLGFDHADVAATFEAADAAGIYEDVLLYTGERVRHYGLSNHKEYFAEATEAYFGVNDFYPFVRAELREHDPACYSLMETIWGPIE